MNSWSSLTSISGYYLNRNRKTENFPFSCLLCNRFTFAVLTLSSLLPLGIEVNFIVLAYSQPSPFRFVSDYLAHRDVLIPLAVVLSGLKAERYKYQFAAVPLAHSTIAEKCAYIHVLVLATKFLQNYGAFAYLASLGLMACHLLGFALVDYSKKILHCL